jgi:hypothetical protein
MNADLVAGPDVAGISGGLNEVSWSGGIVHAVPVFSR